MLFEASTIKRVLSILPIISAHLFEAVEKAFYKFSRSFWVKCRDFGFHSALEKRKVNHQRAASFLINPFSIEWKVNESGRNFACVSSFWEALLKSPQWTHFNSMEREDFSLSQSFLYELYPTWRINWKRYSQHNVTPCGNMRHYPRKSLHRKCTWCIKVMWKERSPLHTQLSVYLSIPQNTSLSI